MSSHRGTHRSSRTTRSGLLRGIALFTVCGLGIGAVTGFAIYEKFNENITVVDLPAAAGASRPPVVAAKVQLPDGPSGALNVLLLGSDTREGAGNRVGGESAGLSDTAMIVHVAANRQWAQAVSIPRDTMVNRPSCARKDGQGLDPGGLSMFNTAYVVGGPACTVATVEAASQVRIDHFAVVDFAGFKAMVDAVGGVQICVPKEVNDTVGDIRLAKGTYVADGETALKYVRERHVLSANGDLGRVKRQQVFLAALATKATSAGTLSDPTKLYALLNAATTSLTTDQSLGSLTALAGLAREVDKVGVSQIRFSTIPVRPYPADPNRVEFSDRAATVWNALRTDTPLTVQSQQDKQGTASAATGSPTSRQPGATNRPSKTAPRTSAAIENGLC